MTRTNDPRHMTKNSRRYLVMSAPVMSTGNWVVGDWSLVKNWGAPGIEVALATTQALERAFGGDIARIHRHR